jgi:hypothetical protein
MFNALGFKTSRWSFHAHRPGGEPDFAPSFRLREANVGQAALERA